MTHDKNQFARYDIQRIKDEIKSKQKERKNFNEKTDGIIETKKNRIKKIRHQINEGIGEAKRRIRKEKKGLV